MAEKILFLYSRLRNSEKFIIFLLPIVTSFADILNLFSPYLALQFVLGNISFLKIVLLFSLILMVSFLKVYIELSSSKIIFGMRLSEVAACSIKSIETDVESIDLKNGKERINLGQEAVSFGNDYGIEALFNAFLIVVSECLFFSIVLFLGGYINFYFALFLFFTIVLHFVLLHRIDQKIYAYQSEWLADKVREEKLRRTAIVKKYAKDIRIREVSGDFIRLLKDVQKKIFNYITLREKYRLKMDVILGFYTLVRNAFIILYLLYYCNAPLEYIVLWIGILLYLNDHIRQFSAATVDVKNNELSFQNLLKLYRYKSGEESEKECLVEDIKNIYKNNTLFRHSEICDLGNYVMKIDNISFGYTEEHVLFSNFSANIKRGEKIALIGHNGVGKSTFIRVLAGLYKPKTGCIQVFPFGNNNLLEHISIAFQDNHLFAFSLIENLTGYNLERWNKVSLSEKDKLNYLIHKFQMNEVLARTPKGIECSCGTQLDEGGVDFSGGEQQNFSIIRSGYKDSELLFLDEPTASLDAIKEKKLYQQMDKLFANKTVFFVSHRLGSTKFCDRIFFIKKSGEIIDSTFDVLYNTEEEFKMLYEKQSNYYRKDFR